MSTITGLHHVTALAGKPQQNLDFYTRVLGLRLVKRTVNFDDPHTYHLYYGDEIGSPGTLITLFPHPMAKRAAQSGVGIRDTFLRVPPGSLDFWSDRLEQHAVTHARHTPPPAGTISFEDRDGMRFTLRESPEATPQIRSHAVIPHEHAIAGIEEVTLHVPDPPATAAFLADTLQFQPVAGAGDQALTIGSNRVELVPTDGPAQAMGAGAVHHVAWRVPDDQAQAEMIQRLHDARIAVTPIMDRLYFRSVYFRIPGGVPFEIATDGPGFIVDEPAGALGSTLKLPPQLESRRGEIEARLGPLSLG